MTHAQTTRKLTRTITWAVWKYQYRAASDLHTKTALLKTIFSSTTTCAREYDEQVLFLLAEAWQHHPRVHAYQRNETAEEECARVAFECFSTNVLEMHMLWSHMRKEVLEALLDYFRFQIKHGDLLFSSHRDSVGGHAIKHCLLTVCIGIIEGGKIIDTTPYKPRALQLLNDTGCLLKLLPGNIHTARSGWDKFDDACLTQLEEIVQEEGWTIQGGVYHGCTAAYLLVLIHMARGDWFALMPETPLPNQQLQQIPA